MIRIQREKYLKEHENEYPFPLNGTDWARLVHLHKYLDHQKPCDCEGCEDFFVTMHHSGLREHEEESARRALKYWFWLGRQNGYPKDVYTPEKTSQEQAWELLSRLSSDPELLAEAERKWVKMKTRMFEQKSQQEAKLPEEDDEPFWNESEAELWESRPNPESKRILGPTLNGDNQDEN